MNNRQWLARTGLVLGMATVAMGAVAEISIEDGYVRAMPPGAPNSAAFLRLVNDGTEDVVIDSGASAAAARVEFHHHVHANGMMRMEQQPSITVPAGGEFVLEPGAHHLMLMDLAAPLKEGDTVEIHLMSGNKEVVAAELPVRSVMHEHH